MGNNSSISRPRTCRNRAPYPPGGNPQDPQYEELMPRLTEVSREILLPFLKIVVTTDNFALALVNKVPASILSEWGLWLINPWIYNMKCPGSNLCLKFLFLSSAGMSF